VVESHPLLRLYTAHTQPLVFENWHVAAESLHRAQHALPQPSALAVPDVLKVMVHFQGSLPFPYNSLFMLQICWWRQRLQRLLKVGDDDGVVDCDGNVVLNFLLKTNCRDCVRALCHGSSISLHAGKTVIAVIRSCKQSRFKRKSVVVVVKMRVACRIAKILSATGKQTTKSINNSASTETETMENFNCSLLCYAAFWMIRALAITAYSWATQSLYPKRGLLCHPLPPFQTNDYRNSEERSPSPHACSRAGTRETAAKAVPKTPTTPFRGGREEEEHFSPTWRQ
jgi:hypothetical protein